MLYSVYYNNYYSYIVYSVCSYQCVERWDLCVEGWGQCVEGWGQCVEVRG